MRVTCHSLAHLCNIQRIHWLYRRHLMLVVSTLSHSLHCTVHLQRNVYNGWGAVSWCLLLLVLVDIYDL